MIERLRTEIRAIERVPVTFGHPPVPGTAPRPPACSSTGGEQAEAPPLHTLTEAGLHELKPASHGDTPAALGFALGMLSLTLRGSAAETAPLLWCLTESAIQEWGAPYAPGLLGFGLDPERLLIVKTQRPKEAAWVLEEGLKSGALAALLGQTEIKQPVMARRLGLAAKSGGLPCLLLSDHGQGGLPGTLTRWRIETAASREAKLDAKAPGLCTFHLTLERAPSLPPGRSWTMEWDDEAYGFRLAPPLADREAEAGAAQRSSAGAS
ncbi:hypothetical protein V6C03_01085 [Methyloligella sp. 2.7D]|uniref:ImuA family protein n=1 Tax=unclassified Methyloligella TaxID=2625955 RepID=UPI00157C33FF|nr:hypothetical protein [Methyloligella sp. GL2]QKP76744.1 hypothetical protein HT051_04330 [Methyloligella sp. GL2]